MEKICNSVQYNDIKGLIYADTKALKIDVFKKIADDYNIKIENEIIGLQFFNGQFLLIELIDENDGIYNIKRHKINISFEKIFSYFKRFSFCMTYEKYLNKECILEY
jgi:hypothetical protein